MIMYMSNESRLPNGLTQKQFNFYNNLISQMKENGKTEPTKAAISAGFASRCAATVAGRLMKKPEGQAYLQSLHKEVTSSSIATLEWVMDKLTKIATLSVLEDGTFDPSTLQFSLKAISEINKIKGYYAPAKTVSLNMTMDDVQFNRAKELTEKYTRAY